MCPKMQTPLNTRRLTLRRFCDGDLRELVKLHSDTEVMRYITNGRPDDPLRLERDVLPRWMEYATRYAGWGFFAAELLETREFVGWFHLNPVPDSPGEFDIGWRLHRHFWGRGLAIEGALALVAELAWSNRARRIIARTMAGNKASQRIMEKLGMTFEGEFQETRFPGECQCALRYSADWSTIVHRRVWLARQGLNDRVIRRLSSGWLAIFDYQTIPGYTVLLSDPVHSDLNAAPAKHRQLFLREMGMVGDALLKATGCNLINYMILGNTDRALHAHITPRFADEEPARRKTGPWAYFPDAHPQQQAFDRRRDQELMDRLGRELDAIQSGSVAK